MNRHVGRHSRRYQRSISGRHAPVVVGRSLVVGGIVPAGNPLELVTTDKAAERLEICGPFACRIERICGNVGCRWIVGDAVVPALESIVGLSSLGRGKAEVAKLDLPRRLPAVDGKAKLSGASTGAG
jgi:hypothetical protein